MWSAMVPHRASASRSCAKPARRSCSATTTRPASSASTRCTSIRSHSPRWSGRAASSSARIASGSTRCRWSSTWSTARSRTARCTSQRTTITSRARATPTRRSTSCPCRCASSATRTCPSRCCACATTRRARRTRWTPRSTWTTPTARWSTSAASASRATRTRARPTPCSTPRARGSPSGAWPTTSSARPAASAPRTCPTCWPSGCSWASERASAAQVGERLGQAIEPVLAEPTLEQEPDVAQRVLVAAEHEAPRVGVRADGDEQLQDRARVALVALHLELDRRAEVPDDANDQRRRPRVQLDVARQLDGQLLQVRVGVQQLLGDAAAALHEAICRDQQLVEDHLLHAAPVDQARELLLGVLRADAAFVALHEVRQEGHRLQQVQRGRQVAAQARQPIVAPLHDRVLDVRVVARLQVVDGGLVDARLRFRADTLEQLAPPLGLADAADAQVLQQVARGQVLGGHLGDLLVLVEQVLLAD